MPSLVLQTKKKNEKKFQENSIQSILWRKFDVRIFFSTKVVKKMLKDIRVQRSKELRGGLLAKRHWSVCLERLEKNGRKKWRPRV